MTLLSDTEQKKLLQEIYNTTQTKVEAVIKRYGLDKIPDEIKREVQALRQENAKQRGRGRGLWNALSHGLGVFKSEADKLFKD